MISSRPAVLILQLSRGWVMSLMMCAPVSSAFAAVRLLTGDLAGNPHGADSTLLDLSSDGDFVLFHTSPPVSGTASGITTSGFHVRQLSTQSVRYVGDASVVGGPEASFSDNGRYLAWCGTDGMIYWRDSVANVTRVVTQGADGISFRPVMSADGRYVAYASLARNVVVNRNALQPAGRAGVYLYDSVAATSTVVSLGSSGKPLNKGIGAASAVDPAGAEFDFSLDGKTIVFSSDSTMVHPARSAAYPAGLRCVYRRNLVTGAVDLVNRNMRSEVAEGDFRHPRVSADGRRVAYFGDSVGSSGGPLMEIDLFNPSGTDLYVKDLATGMVWWGSATSTRELADGSLAPNFALSGNGKTIAFGSTGTNYVDFNTDPDSGTRSKNDVFRADLGEGGSTITTLVTSAPARIGNVDFSVGPLLPGDGSYTAFCTYQVDAMLGRGNSDSGFYHGFGVDAPSLIPTPDISVQELRGSELEDGRSSTNFGTVKVASSGIEKVFVIRNVGNSPLRQIRVTKSGRHAADFVVSQAARNSLAPGGGTSFKVRFKPGIAGSRKAFVRITSNDPDESAFMIRLQGLAVK